MFLFPINTVANQSNTIYFIYTSIGDKSVKIYPNPVKDHLVVEYKLSDETKVSIRLYDKLGQLVTVLLPDVRQGRIFIIWNFRCLKLVPEFL